jgi:hypothetical protein
LSPNPFSGNVSRTCVAIAGAVAFLSALTACGNSGAHGASASVLRNVKADTRTRVIAEAEFKRQCTIDQQSFPKEADITRDLDSRLGALGISHLAWKNWHDQLATSPELVRQLAEVSKLGCS